MVNRENSMSSSSNNQYIPLIITIFASLLTLPFLYTLTNDRSVLCVVFVISYVIIDAIKDYIVNTLYPNRKDGKVETRRIYLVKLCEFMTSVIVVIFMKLLFEWINILRVKMNIQWYSGMVLAATIITFVFSYIESN